MNRLKKKPFISVIVPVYNKEQYVEESINSVLNQTYKDFELIIIDDASTDESLKVVESISDPRIKVFKRSEPGPGGYAARNLGVEKAQSEWITFLDADDKLSDNHVEEIVSFTNKWDVDFLSFGYLMSNSDKNKKVFYSKEGVFDRVKGIKLFSEFDVFNTNSVTIKKSLFEKAGGFPAGLARMGGDADLWLRILLSTDKVGFSPKITSFQIKDRSGIITNPNNKTEKHPLVNSVANYLDNSISKNERKALKTLSNRKSLSWSLDRKRYGSFNYRELGYLYPLEFKLRDWLRSIVLLMPKVVYRSYHKMMYGFY